MKAVQPDSGRKQRSPVAAYLLALFLVPLVLWGRLVLGAQTEGPMLIVFAVPIIVSAYWGGLGPGLLATGAAFLGASYYLLPPLHSFAVASVGERWHQAILLLSGGSISVICEALRRARDRAEAGRAAAERSQTAAAQLAAIVDDSDDAIIGKDLTGAITSWNYGAEKLFGYTAGEMVGSSITRLIPADRQAEEEHILGKIRQGKRVESFETLRRTKDGRLIDVSVTASPIRNAAGTVIGASKIAHAITARKRMELALQEREEQLLLYAEHSPAAIAMFDRDMKYLVASRRWVEDYRLGNRSVIGCSHYEIFPEIPPRWVEIHRRCLAGAVEQCAEEPFPRADGKTDWIRWEVRPWRRPDGTIGGIIIFSEDITARKAAEAAMHASQARYRTLFEYAPDGIVIADRASTYLDANPSMCRMLGYTREEFIGLHASDIVVAEEVPHIGQTLAVTKAKAAYQREWQFRRKDGSVFAAEVSGTVMPDGNLLGVIRDITERKEVETALRESQALYHSLVDQMPAGVFRKDAAGRYVFVNASFCRLRNTTPDQFLGRTPGELTETEAPFKSEAAEHHAEIMRTGRTIEVVDEYCRNDGKTVYFHVVKSPVYDSDGRITGTQGVVIDITEQRRAEEAHKFFRSLMDRSGEIIEVIDPQTGGVLDMNEEACRAHGYTREEYLKLTVFELHPTLSRAQYEENQRRLRQSGPLTIEGAHRRKDGTTFPSEVSLSLVKLDREYLVAIVRNITARKQSDQKIREQLDELLRWQEMMLDREERVLALKAEVNDLLHRQKESPRYSNPAPT
jgi:PAS domain S-box-containing protein